MLKKDEYIVVDLDGTLADSSHRVHHVQQTNKDWDAFYAGIADDKPNEKILELVLMYAQAGYQIVYLTGRSTRKDIVEATGRWISNLPGLGHYNYHLLMRRDGDWRPDYVVKLEIAKNFGLTPQNVVMCLDDRNSVIKMWRDNGYTALQVADGDF